MASEGREHRFTQAIPGTREQAVKSVQEYRDRLDIIWDLMKRALEQAREDMAKYADQKRTAVPDEGYNVGDMVMLSSKHVYTMRPSKKLEWKTFGPFKITAIVGEAKMARQLELPAGMRRMYPVFHVSQMMPYKANELEGRGVEAPPPPEVLETGDLGWVVDKIVHSKELRQTRAGRRCQLVLAVVNAIFSERAILTVTVNGAPVNAVHNRSHLQRSRSRSILKSFK